MNYKSLSEGLRDVLSTRGITYKEIANNLGMSESGVKKMLTGEDIGYNKLASILETLDLKLEDLMSVSPKPYEKLTTEQDKFFEKNPKHFNFLLQLHHYKMKVELLKKANNKLSKEKINQFLQDLEKIKVIQITNGVINSRLTDGFSFDNKTNERNLYNTLIEKLLTIRNDKWKSWMFEGLGTFSLTQKSALELRNEMKALLDEFSARSEREKKIYDSKDLVETGTVFLNLPVKLQELFPII